MDEEMVERVKAWVLKGFESRERARGERKLGGTLRFFGLTYFITDINAENCKRMEDHCSWHALKPREPRANKAKYAEQVEEYLDWAKFWETAGAMLKEAKVKTLGELLEHE